MAQDVRGKQFVVGQQVGKAAKRLVIDGLHIKLCTVTKVSGDRVYLDDSKQPLRFPDRVVIVK